MAAPLLAALTYSSVRQCRRLCVATVVLGPLIAVVVPFPQVRTGVCATDFITGMAVASTILDVNPFSTNGALVFTKAQGEHKQTFFDTLLN